jgi:tRNA (guanine-N7-)-methyltransferase
MSKNKLAKFAEMETFPHVFQLSSNDILGGKTFDLRGKWNADFFGNNNPIVLELGCGKGEYTVELAQKYPDKNFIGVDIKGARIWTGAKKSLENGLKNVAFIRADIEMIARFFGTGEVSEIWLTFPDPQMRKTNKRLSSTNFLRRYVQFLAPNGLLHLKTDSNFMFSYTCAVVDENKFSITLKTKDLYAEDKISDVLNIKTFYERQWLGRGISIKYICFRLENRETFVEPDIEIEKDAYRSFGRNANN